jgi:molybdopterin converting factor small subunit
MPRVFIPPLLRPLTAGRETIDMAGQTVAEVIDQLEALYPGVRSRLVEGDRLKPGLSVGIGTKLAARGLWSKVGPEDEVHFLPAIGGG